MSKYFSLFFFLFILTANTFGLIRNYENSENLENAKIYCPSYAPDKDLVDRDKATSFYKAYLKEYPDSINRSKVLSRIGMNYAQYENKSKGVSRNFDIASDYFKEAIKADPDFVCYETIVARTNLASIAKPGDEQFSERLKVCKWLESISDDQIESSARREIELQMPVRTFYHVTEEQKQELAEKFDATESSLAKWELEISVKKLRSTVTAIKKSAETNLLSSVFSTSAPGASLERITIELPGTEVAERAAQELEKIMAGDLYLPEIETTISQIADQEIVENGASTIIEAPVPSKQPSDARIPATEQPAIAPDKNQDDIKEVPHENQSRLLRYGFPALLCVISIVVVRLVFFKRRPFHSISK